MALVDTNVIIHWLLNDHPTLTRQAQAIITRASNGELVITLVVTAEIVYALRSKGYDLHQLMAGFDLLMREPAFMFEEELVVRRLMGVMQSSPKLDFADCYLIARGILEDQTVASLDGPLLRALRKMQA